MEAHGTVTSVSEPFVLRSTFMHARTNVYAFMDCTCATQTHSVVPLYVCMHVEHVSSMRVIGAGADVETDCRESPTTCSISGFCCLGEPPCIYTPAWHTEQRLSHEAAICVSRMTI